MARESDSLSFIPLSRDIRLMASCQPSGVVRSHEMRVRFPLASLVWHVPHLDITSAFVTGMPSSSVSAGCDSAVCACAFCAVHRAPTLITTSNALGMVYSPHDCFNIYDMAEPAGYVRSRPSFRDSVCSDVARHGNSHRT